jgi:hypothetical protein
MPQIVERALPEPGAGQDWLKRTLRNVANPQVAAFRIGEERAGCPVPEMGG